VPNRTLLFLLGGLAAAAGLYLWLRSRATAADPSGGASDALGGALDYIDVTASRITNAITSRGYRNNNPGNLRTVGRNPWQGQVGDDNGYGVYDTPQNGTRALGHQLRAYANRDLNTVGEIISTWAPASDNNNTAAYIADVASQLNVDSDAAIDVEPALADLARAIARHENGYLDSSYNWMWVYLA
jgi:hypothetical protein